MSESRYKASLHYKNFYKMSFLTLWLVVLILERSIASKHRSVNLALETVLQFDKAEDFNVINKVQDFLSHIQVLLKKQQRQQVSDNVTTTRRNNKYKFTDFVEDLITIFKSFEDNNLKEVFRIVDRDFRKRNIDNELINDNARRFVSRKLTGIKNQPAIEIRRYLDTILRELRSDKNTKSSFLLDFINSLYKNDSDKKLSKLIKRLNLFRKSARKSKVVLKGIIDKVVNDVIYDHYNNLENNEKRYIKNLLSSYLKDDITTRKVNIKQRAKVTETIQESLNTDDKTDKSIQTEQITAFELTPETFKDISEETTKTILTHITLYPRAVKEKKLLKFRTGSPSVHIIENEEITKDRKHNKEINGANEIFANQSVEINVNLMLKQSQGLQDRENSQMVESFRAKPSPIKGFLETFERALKKNSRKKKKSFKSSTHDLSVETFGSLYKIKTPKKYNNKIISRLGTYNGKTTVKDRNYKSTNVEDIVIDTSFRENMHVVEDNRRVNRPKNLKEDKVTESDLKNLVTTTTRHFLTTKVLKPLIISTAKVRTITVKTDTSKSSSTTTESYVLNEILNNNNVTEKVITKNIPLLEGISTNTEFRRKESITEFVSKSHINNKTTLTDVPIAFDVDNYIKNSEILNLKSDDKKKQIEEKMKADFGVLLDSPTTNTTEGFTDIFKELEDAFQI